MLWKLSVVLVLCGLALIALVWIAGHAAPGSWHNWKNDKA